MGLSDRDYARDEPRGIFLGGDQPMYVRLILVNVGVYLVDLIFFEGTLSGKLELKGDLFQKPWQAWQLLTYGFAHDPEKFTHVLFNMLGLWFFGREIETVYGRKEFLRIYLSLVVLSGLVWEILAELGRYTGSWNTGPVLGASGAVVGVVVLFICHFPRRTILLFGVIPMPTWVLGIIMILWDVKGAIGRENIAFTVHLAGAVLAFLYYQTGWNLGRMLPAKFSLGSLKSRPKLRLHDPELDQPSLEAEVDRILAKISEQGESSLSSAERKTLEKASRRYQQRRR